MHLRLRTAIATLLALVMVGSGCADDSTTPPVSGAPSRPTLDPSVIGAVVHRRAHRECGAGQEREKGDG